MERGGNFLDRLLNYKMPPLIKRSIILLRRVRNEIRDRRAANHLAKKVKYCRICGWQGEQFDTRFDEIMQQEQKIVCT